MHTPNGTVTAKQPFPLAHIPEFTKVLWRDDRAEVLANRHESSNPEATKAGLVLSEVLLPPLLGFNGIQDWLPLGPVLLPDLFHFLFHHGVEGQEPLLKVLHSPALEKLIVSILRDFPIGRILQRARYILAKAVDLIFLFFLFCIQGKTVLQAAWSHLFFSWFLPLPRPPC